MKIQNIYHLLQAALLLLLVSCTQEEFPAVQDKAQQLTISVTDGGYTSAVENMKTRVETRAVENGYTTEFTEGDACGFYMVRGGKPVYSNVKLTAEKDAATGGIMWKTDGTTLAKIRVPAECFVQRVVPLLIPVSGLVLIWWMMLPISVVQISHWGIIFR